MYIFLLKKKQIQNETINMEIKRIWDGGGL